MDLWTYEKTIKNLEEIKKQFDLTEEQRTAIDKAIRLLSISNELCLI